MRSYLSVISILFLIPSIVWSQNKVILSEPVLNGLIKKEPPGVQEIEASFLAVKSQQLDKSTLYSARIDGEGSVYRSDERLLNNFDGAVTRSANSYSLGVVKPTPYGVTIGAKAFSGKSTNAFVTDAANAGVSVTLAVDLFQNFLGRRALSDLEKSEMSVKRAELEKVSQLKAYEANIRKLYWALVANNEQYELITNLVATAEQQYKEATRRQRQGVADSGEVARYRSEWTTRKANLLTIGYQKSDLLRSLRELLPDLAGKEIVLAPYSVEKIQSKVLACTAQIGQHNAAPVQYTNYDEIVALLEEERELEEKVARTVGDPTVQLTGEYASVGRDFGAGAAQDNFYSDPRGRRSLGLRVSIPIGGRNADSSEVKERLAKKRYYALAQNNLLKIKAFHQETAKKIELLHEVVKNQRDTNESLSKSLKLSRRKYKQARISLQELISEKDLRLNSQLSEIQTNLTIINSLMDYFSIYGDFPCEFNRI